MKLGGEGLELVWPSVLDAGIQGIQQGPISHGPGGLVAIKQGPQPLGPKLAHSFGAGSHISEKQKKILLLD